MCKELRIALLCWSLIGWQYAASAQTASQSAQGQSKSSLQSQPQSQPLSQALSQPLSQPASPQSARYGANAGSAVGQAAGVDLPDTGSAQQARASAPSKSSATASDQNVPPCSYFGAQTHCANTGAGNGRAPNLSGSVNAASTRTDYLQNTPIPMVRSGGHGENGILHSSVASPSLGASPVSLTEAMSEVKTHHGDSDGPTATPGHLTPSRSAATAPPKPQRVNTGSKAANAESSDPKKKVEACVYIRGTDICS